MPSAFSLVRFNLAALLLGLAGRATAQGEMPKGSPFMPAGAAVAPVAPGETIEFAAVRTIGGKTDINLYDTQGKKNHWIPLGGTVDGMSVLNYDVRREQVVAKIGGVEKVLSLRKARAGAGGPAPIVTAPAMGFNTPTLSAPEPVVQKIQPPPPASAPASSDASTVVAPTQPAPAPTQPAAPLTVARQEEEARMLVSDLLEIGMAQRKAYEEKQKQATTDPNAAPAPPAPTPAAANPNGPPGGG